MDSYNISQVGTKAIEKTGDPFILTRNSACGYFSFVDNKKHQFDYARPPPIYMKLEDINERKQFDKTSAFSDFKIEKNGELRVTNEEIKERQRGVLKEVFTSMASKLLEGKNVIGLSLPVRIFEPRSQMERLIDSLHFFPFYMAKAKETADPAERLSHILTAIISGIHHCLSQYKPFNPLLGETYSGKLDDKTDIYMEHINHHPPITSYLFTGDGWKMYGKWTYNAELGPVRTKIFSEGLATIEFADGDKYNFIQPAVVIKGIVIGTRYFKPVMSTLVFNEEKGLKAVIKFGEKKKGLMGSMLGSKKNDVVNGLLYKYDKEIHAEMMADKSWVKMLDKIGGMPDVKEQIGKFSGSWIEEFKYNGKVLWNIDANSNDYTQQEFGKNAIPSDLRFREDIIWLTYGNEKYAQEWKVLLETQQREDRTNRNKNKVNQ